MGTLFAQSDKIYVYKYNDINTKTYIPIKDINEICNIIIEECEKIIIPVSELL
jgi:hypothetical protein